MVNNAGGTDVALASSARREARPWAVGCGLAVLCLPVRAALDEARATTVTWG